MEGVDRPRTVTAPGLWPQREPQGPGPREPRRSVLTEGFCSWRQGPRGGTFPPSFLQTGLPGGGRRLLWAQRGAASGVLGPQSIRSIQASSLPRAGSTWCGVWGDPGVHGVKCGLAWGHVGRSVG